ncbi:hypothetical protein LH128_11061 [Sphingomonas sp. LH128]|jgi:hypothetical protein|uniref:hypothetical protein n=1 Tax=Sphingomonadaceae TaxID=41297 RepID=UPI00027CC9A3|nr:MULTISPECIES: hypothetical protein [Sphingomonadaceae]EJU12999.1 hypothetical protein LH128_11061 [Sphingomonas sp. LH128]
MKKTLITAAIAAAALAPAAVMAQAAAPAAAPAASATATANPTTGAKVFDAAGAEVGTVEAVQGDIVTVSTGTARAGLPKNAFVTRDKGLTIGMTKAELESAVNGAKAENTAAKDAAIVADAPIKSSDGVVLGTVSKVEGDNVTVALSGGSAAQLKKSYLGLGADGSLALGMSAADFAKATQSAAGGQPGADAAATAGGAAAATTPEGQ